jgi:hypothetical protein
MSIKCKAQITIYEINGESSKLDTEDLILESHWNIPSFIVLHYPGSNKKIAVSASDLTKAITRCTG